MAKNFLIRFAQAMGLYFLGMLMLARSFSPPVDDYLYRLGWHLGTTWYWGVGAAFLLALLSQSRKA